jgi:hypothetical protein
MNVSVVVTPGFRVSFLSRCVLNAKACYGTNQRRRTKMSEMTQFLMATVVIVVILVIWVAYLLGITIWIRKKLRMS